MQELKILCSSSLLDEEVLYDQPLIECKCQSIHYLTLPYFVILGYWYQMVIWSSQCVYLNRLGVFLCSHYGVSGNNGALEIVCKVKSSC